MKPLETKKPDERQASLKGIYIFHGALGWKSVIISTPLDTYTKLVKPKRTESKKYAGNLPYRELIGTLTYLSTTTRPDISHSENPDWVLAVNEWTWGPQQKTAFERIKKDLTEAPLLAFYDPELPTRVSADSTSYGLGGVLLQQQKKGEWQPVSYISRMLSDTEQNYSNIEREALAVAWCCDKLKEYIIGKTIEVETDHKPLLRILTTKNLDDLTPRLQRLRLRMMRYPYTMSYTPGKHLAAPDCLSRSPLDEREEYDLNEEIGAYVQAIVSSIQTTDKNIEMIRRSQENGPIFKTLAEYTREGWPSRDLISPHLRPYFPVKDEISTVNGLLVRGERLIVPIQLRQNILQRIHAGHFGVSKCRLRAQGCVWWPGISSDIDKEVRFCQKCIEHRVNRNEPLLPAEFPLRPWEKAAIDLFKLEDKWFLAITDCYSRYLEIATLQTLSAKEVIDKCKATFSRHGIPLEIRSDSGTQFSLKENSEFIQFSRDYNFQFRTSSPHFHQSNGSAEAAVKIAKSLLKKNQDDPYLALLAYRNSPLPNGFSPAELSMGRKLRDTLPRLAQHLDKKPDTTLLRVKEEQYRQKYKQNYDERHGVHPLDPFDIGDKVWITDLKRPGIIITPAKEPRSYIVETDKRTVRRNRVHLIPYSHHNQSLPYTPTTQASGEVQEPGRDESTLGQAISSTTGVRKDDDPKEMPPISPGTTPAAETPPQVVSRYGWKIRCPKRLDL
ncbi:uncharacterized protein K02A2.6-like [Cimex lectularius]|uniref:RNA-directed DNA polymerase n=1 Tax=Cimex lectularius TaxID=79782 RepID=A0A8I6RQP2_CIMLE|nr:uncharacterized protein K02A2.6-like [Cimex lectularius]